MPTRMLTVPLLIAALQGGCAGSGSPTTDDTVDTDGTDDTDDTDVIETDEYNFHTTRYVDGTLSEGCAEQYDPETRSCGTGSHTAHASFASATTAAAPGVHFLIRAGSYPEVLRLTVSGTAATYIGYSAYESESVTIEGVDSVDGGEEYGPIWLDHVSYNLVEGLTVTGSVGFLRAVDAHYNVINKCIFDTSTAYPGASKRGGLYFAWSHYNKVLNSQILRGTDSLSLIHSDHNLVAGNAFDLAGHDSWSIKCGNFNVIRDNDITNPQQKLGSVFDCEAATTNWHGNGELAESTEILDATKHNLIDGNVFHDAVDYYSTSGGNGIQYAGQEGIIRNNVFVRNNVGIGMARYSDEALYNYGNRVFHNVFYDNRCGGLSLRGTDDGLGVADNEYKNNILWQNKGWDADCAGTSPAQILYRSPFSGHRFVRNVIASTLGDTVIRAEFGSETTIAEFSGSAFFQQTLALDPQFVNESGDDYHLQAESPMIDAAAFLTTVASASGTGTELQLADVGYFYDGFGIPGEVGDVIQLEGQTETATVRSIDYERSVITLDRALTWTQGVGVAIAFQGAAPDVGAFERQ